MTRYHLLSYPLGINTPLYPGTKQVKISSIKAIKKGDSCNTSEVIFSNHAGTHIDAPRHFYDSGMGISDYKIESLFFKKPLIFDCRKDLEQSIEIKDLESLLDVQEFNILLIRTGFSKYRDNNAENYSHKNPYFLPETAAWLRKNFPSLRAVGFDFISAASSKRKEEGKETHKIFLKETGPAEKAVLLIEDMRLPAEIKKLDQVIVAPLFIEGADSAPCTIIGILND